MGRREVCAPNDRAAAMCHRPTHVPTVMSPPPNETRDRTHNGELSATTKAARVFEMLLCCVATICVIWLCLRSPGLFCALSSGSFVHVGLVGTLLSDDV